MLRDCSEMPKIAPHTAWMPSQKSARRNGLAGRAGLFVSDRIAILSLGVHVEGEFRRAAAERLRRNAEHARRHRLEVRDAQTSQKERDQREWAHETRHSPRALASFEEPAREQSQPFRAPGGNPEE